MIDSDRSWQTGINRAARELRQHVHRGGLLGRSRATRTTSFLATELALDGGAWFRPDAQSVFQRWKSSSRCSLACRAIVEDRLDFLGGRGRSGMLPRHSTTRWTSSIKPRAASPHQSAGPANAGVGRCHPRRQSACAAVRALVLLGRRRLSLSLPFALPVRGHPDETC